MYSLLFAKDNTKAYADMASLEEAKQIARCYGSWNMPVIVINKETGTIEFKSQPYNEAEVK